MLDGPLCIFELGCRRLGGPLFVLVIGYGCCGEEGGM